MFGFFGESKKITEKLYEQNLELAVKNKTLSLLESLYQASVLTLMPEDMASKIADIIRKDLNLEFAGVFAFEKESDSLLPLAFSKSERLIKTLNTLGFLFKDIKITNASKHGFFKKAIYDKKENSTDNLQEVWGKLIPRGHLAEVTTESNIKTILLYPLIKGEEVGGVLLLGLNRDYATLNTFEKGSIKSCINAIALLLDKAYLYKDLQASYEVEKRAHEIEKKAKEEIEKLDKFKDNFLTQTQHDLRTPLTAILGYTDMLQKGMFGKQTKKTLEVVQKIQAVSKSMKAKADNFLDLAQFELGKSPVVLTEGVGVFPILDEVKNDLDFKAQSKGIYLNLEKPAAPSQRTGEPRPENSGREQDLFITADREKLKAAIFNIVDNAVKYTPTGGVTITLKNHDSVKIIISDTGIGLPKEKLSTLFGGMFERTEAAKKTAAGAGIGLYLSAQIIKAHHGKVWVESEGEGKGSQFYIELPV